MASQASQTDRLLSNAIFIGAPLAVGWLTGRYDPARRAAHRAARPHPALPPGREGDPWLVIARDAVPALLFVAAFILGIRRKYAHQLRP